MNRFRKTIAVIVTIALGLGFTSNAQVSINTDGTNANVSAMLDVNSNDKGMLIPRMTQVQIEEITNPANGLTVYNTDDCNFYVYRDCSLNWTEVALGTGTIASFTCGDPIIDSRDGQSYTTVQIGTQCWMAESLNIGAMINYSSNQTDNGTIEKYCYDNNSANCDVYGGLYFWNEMMQYVTIEGTDGICPTNWHLPTDTEWKTLELHLGMTQAQADAIGWRGTDEGGKLKETGTTHWYAPNAGATNSSGFTSLAGGYTLSGIGFNNIYGSNDNWSSSESGSDAWFRETNFSNSQVLRTTNSKTKASSVRCVRDST